MKSQFRTLLACCAAGALSVSLSACGPDDTSATMSQLALADGLSPGWSMMDLAGVDPEFYADDGELPEALPMQASYAGDYGYAPAYDYAPDEGGYYEPLDESYYYDDGYYDDGYYEDGYYQGGYADDGYASSDGLFGLGGGAGDYGLLALAVSLAGMLGDSPPDYGFAYGDVSPWAWQTSDRYYRYAEPIDGGYRYYYYEPDAYRPFFVSDPYYSYGYRDDRLVAIYDRDGRRIDARRAQLQRGAAKAYYARAERLYRAAERDRRGVPAPLWARHRDEIAHDRDRWVESQARVPAWRQWEARNAPQLQRKWAGEALVRRGAERSFAKWQKADYETPPPAFYTPQARTERVRQLAELRRERPNEVAERRRERAEQAQEARRAAERLRAEARREAPELRRAERASAQAEAPRPQRAAAKTAAERASERRAERIEQRTQRSQPQQRAAERREDRPTAAERRDAIKERREATQARRQPAREPERQEASRQSAASAAAERRDQARQAAEQRRSERNNARQAAERQEQAGQAAEQRRAERSAARETAQAERQARQEARQPAARPQREDAPRQVAARVERPERQPQARVERQQSDARQASEQRREARQEARQDRQDARAERRDARRGRPDAS